MTLWRSGLTAGLLALSLALSACATPHLQAPQTPPNGFNGPRIEAGTLGRGAFVVQDGARLPYLRWSPENGQQPWAVIVALHGFNDRYSSFRLAGPWWATRGIETWALGDRAQANMTETVRAWRDYAPAILPLPHPSWRNTAWLRKNPWFEAEVLPYLRQRTAEILA